MHSWDLTFNFMPMCGYISNRQLLNYKDAPMVFRDDINVYHQGPNNWLFCHDYAGPECSELMWDIITPQMWRANSRGPHSGLPHTLSDIHWHSPRRSFPPAVIESRVWAYTTTSKSPRAFDSQAKVPSLESWLASDLKIPCLLGFY